MGSGFRCHPTSRAWKGRITVPVAASFFDPQLEENVTVFWLVCGCFAGDGAHFGIVYQPGLPADEEFPTCAKCVWHTVVKSVQLSFAEVSGLWRGRLHEDEESSAADNRSDRMDPRHAIEPYGCQVRRRSSESLRPKRGQRGGISLQVTPASHEAQSVSYITLKERA